MGAKPTPDIGHQFQETTLALNEALLLGSVHQHELTEAAELLNARLQAEIKERQYAEDEIRRLNVELEQRVVKRTTQLQAANEELEAFSYSVSHDLRAPLRHVMGFVQLLQKDAGPSLSAKSLQHLDTISRSAKRMGDLIDDLLEFSHVGRAALQKANVNLDGLVREIMSEFQVETKGRNIAWKIHPLPMVRADRALLRLVLINLISNAVKFTGARAEATIEIGCVPAGVADLPRLGASTAGANAAAGQTQPGTAPAQPPVPHTPAQRGPGGDGSPRETGGAEALGRAAEAVSRGETVIFIRDNGAGFDPHYAGKLFGVFQRLHSCDEFEGTGIGLANVQRIIQRHGGRVWAEGVVDGGATFYFSIPKQNQGIDER